MTIDKTFIKQRYVFISLFFRWGGLKMKKVNCLLLVFVLLLAICAVPVSAFMPGDIDDNGKVEAADARICLRAAVGLDIIYAGTEMFTAADVNGNGNIEAADARLILRTAVGLQELSPGHFSFVSVAAGSSDINLKKGGTAFVPVELNSTVVTRLAAQWNSDAVRVSFGNIVRSGDHYCLTVAVTAEDLLYSQIAIRLYLESDPDVYDTIYVIADTFGSDTYAGFPKVPDFGAAFGIAPSTFYLPAGDACPSATYSASDLYALGYRTTDEVLKDFGKKLSEYGFVKLNSYWSSSFSYCYEYLNPSSGIQLLFYENIGAVSENVDSYTVAWSLNYF